jgi:signal peptidase
MGATMIRGRKLSALLGNVLLGLVLVVATIFVVNVAVNGFGTLPGGYRPLVVLSGSMEPYMPTGSLVLTKSVDPATVKVGDVITFRLRTGSFQTDLATHRVEAIKNSPGGVSFVTKGDANQVHDPVPVPASDLVGRVVVVSSLAGSVVEALKTPLFLALVAFGALALIADALWKKVPRRHTREQAPFSEPAARTPRV